MRTKESTILNKPKRIVIQLFLFICILSPLITFGKIYSINQNPQIVQNTNDYEDISDDTTFTVNYVSKTEYDINIHTENGRGSWWCLWFKDRPASKKVEDEDKGLGYEDIEHNTDLISYSDGGGYDFKVKVNANSDGKAPGIDRNNFYDDWFYFTDSMGNRMSTTHWFPLIMSDPDADLFKGQKGISETSTINGINFVGLSKSSKETIGVDVSQTYENASSEEVVPQKIDLIDENGNVISTSTNTVNTKGYNELVFNDLKKGKRYKNVSFALSGYDDKLIPNSFSFKNRGMSKTGVIIFSILIPFFIIVAALVSIFVWRYYGRETTGNDEEFVENDDGYDRNWF